MAEYLIQDETLMDIADAIRAKTGGTALIKPGDMAAEISAIEAGGGGGGNVETCNISVGLTVGNNIYYLADNFELKTAAKPTIFAALYLSPFICGSLFVITENVEDWNIDEGITLVVATDTYSICQAPSTPGDYSMS